MEGAGQEHLAAITAETIWVEENTLCLHPFPIDLQATFAAFSFGDATRAEPSTSTICVKRVRQFNLAAVAGQALWVEDQSACL
jgi:hypothetical protein